MNARTALLRRPALGFSLVELMIGLAIGMIAIVIMMQVFSVSEGFKRTTTGGDDAQNNGAIAIYGLQRDIRQAGYGLTAMSVIGCNVTLRAGVTVSPMGPVTINHPNIPAAVADANTDTLLVFYGNGNDAPEGDRIEAQPSTATYTLGGFALPASAPSLSVGDRVVAQAQTRPSPCTLTMESVSNVAGSMVTVPTGVAGMSGGALFDLGAAPTVLVYAIRSGNLTVCNYMSANCGANPVVPADWTPIAANVVSLRAQYAKDTTTPNMDAVVDEGGYDQVRPSTACDWSRVFGVRVSLVARNAQYDAASAPAAMATASAPQWAGSASAPIDLSSLADWQHYRYKVFETTIPIRNMTWKGAQPGC